MEEIIKININNKNDLIAKYDEEKLSYELLDYIIKRTILINKNKKIKIIINKNIEIKEDSIKLIKEALKEEYKRSLEERNRNNFKQFVFFFRNDIYICGNKNPK